MIRQIFEDRILVVDTLDNMLQGFLSKKRDNLLQRFLSLLDPFCRTVSLGRLSFGDPEAVISAPNQANLRTAPDMESFPPITL